MYLYDAMTLKEIDRLKSNRSAESKYICTLHGTLLSPAMGHACATNKTPNPYLKPLSRNVLEAHTPALPTKKSLRESGS